MLSLLYNGRSSFFIVDPTKIYQFKVKYFEIKPSMPCLGNISKDHSIDNGGKAGLNGGVKVFSDDYKAIDAKKKFRYT